jgi:hypothetical protein
LRLVCIALSAISAFIVCHLVASGDLFHWIGLLTPSFVFDGLASALPIDEVQAAYDILDRFIMEPGLLKVQVSRLLFVTFHAQVGIGYLGIDFLTSEQERRNQLVRMDMSRDDEEDEPQEKDVNGKQQNDSTKDSKDNKKMQRSRKFQRTAAPFIFYTAVPYMIQIIFYGNINAFSYACFKDDVHRAVRLYDLFDHDNHLVALASHSAKSPDGKHNEKQMLDRVTPIEAHIFSSCSSLCRLHGHYCNHNLRVVQS